MPNMAEPYGRTRRALLNKPGVLLAADHHRARHSGSSWSASRSASLASQLVKGTPVCTSSSAWGPGTCRRILQPV
jgi:hypothetical protein